MTTVINLNILNFFGLKVDKKPVHNNQPDAGNAQRRKAFPLQRTIDVTPSKPVVSCKNPDIEKFREVSVKSTGHPEVLTCYPRSKETHDLKGYSANYFMPKGTNIDSYA